MEHKIVGANGESAFHFTAESFDGFFKEQFIGAGEIHQVVGVDDERLEIISGAQLEHLLAQRIAEFVRFPLPRTRRKNLERVASNAVSTLGGIVNTSGGRGVNANAPGTEAGRAFWGGMAEDILFAGEGARHRESINRSGWLVEM
jgi:hypothetical protein